MSRMQVEESIGKWGRTKGRKRKGDSRGKRESMYVKKEEGGGIIIL